MTLHTPTVVAGLMDKDHHTWDLSQIRAFISSRDAQAIKAIPISNSDLPDRLIWPHTMNERYSVKFRYYYLMKHKKNQVVMKASSSHVIDSNVCFRIWNCQTLPKIKIFLWRSVNGFLPTFEIFFKRKLCQSPICPFCKEQPESIEHTLFLCPRAAKVWFASCIAYRPLPQAFTSLDSWILDLRLCETFNLEEKGWIITHFAFTSWAIWKTRCTMVYDNSNSCPPSPELTASLADRSVVEFISLVSSKENRNHFNNTPVISHQWVNPPVGTVKINCDAAWDKVSNATFDGVVIRDHTGILLDGIAHCFQSLSVVQAEFHAIRSGLELAHVRGFTNVIVETDSKDGLPCPSN
ncbi:unnamed protein product [Prunus armeniaca]|uniref:RNase H type-1 domain-containing protein n=1 Tax=Prunus armeniaca TaxID=36596 RepID=A0A6J5TFU7_PRUAR|nr:unnamed protein product [Prunus armeniaca]